MVNVGYNMKFQNKNLNAIHDILNETVNEKLNVFSEQPTPLSEEEKAQLLQEINNLQLPPKTEDK